jgi:MFS family permease
MSLISHTVDARGRALGVNGMFGSAAVALTPIVTAALCTHLGWQATYRVVGYTMVRHRRLQRLSEDQRAPRRGQRRNVS